MENINSTNNQLHNEDSMNTTDLLIQALSAHFNDNPTNFTSYRNSVDKLLREHIKPMTSRSGKSADGDDWKSQVKQRFSGRGAKWVFVSLEQIESTLVNLESTGIDCTHIESLQLNTAKPGFASQLHALTTDHSQLLSKFAQKVQQRITLNNSTTFH